MSKKAKYDDQLQQDLETGELTPFSTDLNDVERANLRSAYIPHQRIPADVGEVSLARQEFAAECDINNLMAKYESQGVFPTSSTPPQYLDTSDFPDFREAQHIIIEATTAFMTLPAKVRREFDNDPAQFVDFASDPKNIDAMRAWGLAEPAPEKPATLLAVEKSPSGEPSKAD